MRLLVLQLVPPLGGPEVGLQPTCTRAAARPRRRHGFAVLLGIAGLVPCRNAHPPAARADRQEVTATCPPAGGARGRVLAATERVVGVGEGSGGFDLGWMRRRMRERGGGNGGEEEEQGRKILLGNCFFQDNVNNKYYGGGKRKRKTLSAQDKTKH